MSAAGKQEMSGKDRALQARLRQIGVVVLVAGLLAAVLANVTAVPADEVPTANSKRYEYQMEQIGGKSNLLATEIREWFGSLWHGRRLAHTLAILSIGGSLACFFVAHRLNFLPRPDSRAGGGHN